MKSRILTATLAATLVACGQPQESTTAKIPSPPVAKKVPHEMEIHGHKRVDDYYWMRDDKRADPEVLAHLAAENIYKEAMLGHTNGLQEALYEEMVGRLKKDDTTVPVLKNDYWYQSRYIPGGEYPVIARTADKQGATEEILLDVNQMAEGKDYYNVGNYEVSTDNRILAYAEDEVSRRLYTIRFKDLETGQLLEDEITNAEPYIVWANDNKTLFYIAKDPQTLLGYKVMRHKLGTPQAQDTLAYEEKDNTYYTGIGKSRDESTLFIYHASTTTKGQSALAADTPDGQFEKILPLEAGHEYQAALLGDYYYFLTNLDAINFRLIRAPKNNPEDRSQWQEVIPHRESVLLNSFQLFENYLVLNEREGGQARIRVIAHDGSSDQYLEFNDPVYAVNFEDNPSTASETVRIGYSSLTTPYTIFDVALASGEKSLRKQTEVLGSFDPADYRSEGIRITARDGEQIPVSIVYRADRFKRDGTNPIYQYAYGSYGSTIDPYFRSHYLSLLDRGFVVAIAHIRGSQKLGRPWYEDGKMFNKINTFTDYIDVTRGLVTQKYGAADKVFAVGGSAGGLLMGAVVNMQPELYRGVAAHVPFVDVVTTMLDASIPLTTNEYDEWGNPNNKDSYDYMLSYSPYDQVKAQGYPNLLVTTGLHDSQVQYFEPAKWVAKLREQKTDENLLIFHVNMEAGHGGASGRYRRYKERALEFAFFMDLIGLDG
ncbi:S9 family peptidase [Biformimicrobium ophioploci]|uniref:Oligopeptidase B n=1 Tax=Biformimicrobium ophioploci TaxID=3036711 RepID=A0ABQ6LXF0_9GAMM|nr:S9 family peptidase [Microbulbifer sp. NKW57]GMG86749.1 oligopeptidase B [Microbulbifer sp. NKW57]